GDGFESGVDRSGLDLGWVDGLPGLQVGGVFDNPGEVGGVSEAFEVENGSRGDGEHRGQAGPVEGNGGESVAVAEEVGEAEVAGIGGGGGVGIGFRSGAEIGFLPVGELGFHAEDDGRGEELAAAVSDVEAVGGGVGGGEVLEVEN